jgi:hypothetical protein
VRRLAGSRRRLAGRGRQGLLGQRQQALGLVLVGIAPQVPDLALLRSERGLLRLIRRQLDRLRRGFDQRRLAAGRFETGILVRHPDDPAEHRESAPHRQHRPQPAPPPRRLGRRGFAVEAWAAQAAGFGR